MSAFLLHRIDASLDIDSAKAVFKRKGLPQPRCLDFGTWRLLLYPKMLATESNLIRSDDGKCAFCVGTLVYRSLGYKDSLERLQSDYATHCVDKSELIGNFCVGFWDGRRLTLLSDALHAQHLFVNDAGTCLSSSFLAVLAAHPGRLPLNRTAAHEKLATGYIVAPDTLVEGIRHLNRDLTPWLEQTAEITILDNPPPDGLDDSHQQGFMDSVHRHVKVLQGYFKKIEALSCESHAELGLSSGFDSRLLLALSQAFPGPIPLHSHHTLNVHESELAIARQLAYIGGNELTVIPTTRLDEESEERRCEVVYDNLYFFDGRCIHDMGHFGETYTAQYRQKVLGQNRLSLHGLGGEIFRNPYTTPLGRFAWNDWLDYAVFFPFAREACESADAFQDMRQHRNGKIAGRLGIDLSRTVSFHATRRYYGLVRMPDCGSCVNNAYSQVAFVLTPFIEPMTLREALKATSYIGVDGEYEAALIKELSPPLAAVDSQYGHSFSSVPLRHLLKARLNAAIPLRARAARRRRLFAEVSKKPSFDHFRRLTLSSNCLREIFDVLRSSFPASDWNVAMYDDNQKRTSVYVGSFLREFHHKLRL